MKKIIFYLIFGSMIMFSSCATRYQQTSWKNYPPAPYFFRYQVGNVTVIVDHVRERNIAQQVAAIADTHINSKQSARWKSDNIMYLDIIVEQRSFMRRIKMFNTIYVSCTARDAEGNVYAREHEYISGRRTFIVSAEQNVITKRVLNRIMRFHGIKHLQLKSYERKIAKEAQKAEAKMLQTLEELITYDEPEIIIDSSTDEAEDMEYFTDIQEAE